MPSLPSKLYFPGCRPELTSGISRNYWVTKATKLTVVFNHETVKALKKIKLPFDDM